MAQAAQATSPAASTPTSRPPTLQASLMLEGTAEPVTLQLYTAPATPRAPGFSTYLPPELQAQPAPGAKAVAEGVRFTARFGGVAMPQAYLELLPLPAGTTGAQAQVALKRAAPNSVLRHRGGRAEMRFAWAEAERDIALRSPGGGRITGVAALARHGTRWVRVVLQHPPEMAGGLQPRADLVLEHWRWADDGRGL